MTDCLMFDVFKCVQHIKSASYLCSIRCNTLVQACVGVFTDLGRDYSVVRKSLLYKGLRSWRRLLVSNINCPTVYPVLLTNALQKSEKNKKQKKKHQKTQNMSVCSTDNLL